MSVDPLQLIERHRNKGVLVDTNILLLLFVGSFDTDQIARHKRTKKFTIDDYERARLVVERCGKVFTTPNILTEVSNLAGQTADSIRLGIFGRIATAIPAMDESYHASDDLRQMAEFLRYGLTDAGILRAAIEGHLVLTDDLRLWGYLDNLSLPAINITHLQWLI